MIKCIRIGSQLEKGKDQFMFAISYEESNFWAFDIKIISSMIRQTFFNSWEEFKTLHKSCITIKNIKILHINNFKAAYDAAFEVKGEQNITKIIL